MSITTEPVTFTSSGETLVGTLHRPAAAGTRLPAVIVSGAWGTVKEQMPAGYARELAARGFVALAFDFRSWGRSGGRPRSMEDPFAKADDIVAAAEFLAGRADVDARAINGLGICASAAYLARAATLTERIASIALVAPALPSRATVTAQVGGEDAATALRRAAQEAQADFARSGSEQFVPAAQPPAPGAAADYYSDPQRGAIAEWDNTFNLASWTSWLEFDAQAAARELRQPLLVVHSDAAVRPDSVREFVAAVAGPVEQVWLDGVTQFDFYDGPGPMAAAADAVADHFARLAAVPDSIG